jgi:hypothetical protein
MPAIAELDARWGEPNIEAAAFYLRYAHDDLIHGIEWQLAERSSEVTFNPFVPLLACYRAGFYPFVMNRESALLFRFASPRFSAPRSS